MILLCVLISISGQPDTICMKEIVFDYLYIRYLKIQTKCLLNIKKIIFNENTRIYQKYFYISIQFN